MTDHLQRQFDIFVERVYTPPLDPKGEQYTQLQKAWFAGQLVLLTAVLRASTAPEAIAEGILNALHEEINRFFDSLKPEQNERQND